MVPLSGTISCSSDSFTLVVLNIIDLSVGLQFLGGVEQLVASLILSSTQEHRAVPSTICVLLFPGVGNTSGCNQYGRFAPDMLLTHGEGTPMLTPPPDAEAVAYSSMSWRIRIRRSFWSRTLTVTGIGICTVLEQKRSIPACTVWPVLLWNTYVRVVFAW